MNEGVDTQLLYQPRVTAPKSNPQMRLSSVICFPVGHSLCSFLFRAPNFHQVEAEPSVNHQDARVSLGPVPGLDGVLVDGEPGTGFPVEFC